MTDEEIFDLAERHGWMDDFGRWNFKDDGLIKFALALMQAEREACAKVADTYDMSEDVCGSDTAEGISIAIRARGNHGLR
jgi:hypothetical protein